MYYRILEFFLFGDKSVIGFGIFVAALFGKVVWCIAAKADAKDPWEALSIHVSLETSMSTLLVIVCVAMYVRVIHDTPRRDL